MHPPIFLNQISLYFPNAVCFEDFSAQIRPGSRIAIIGKNGGGKSTLLKIIKGDADASAGEVVNNKQTVFGYVPQLISQYEDLSGGEKFNKCLSAALGERPDILLLDEPTNHLDLDNRKSLMRMLNFYRGTLIIVSHDEELLNNSIDEIWHIKDRKIKIFRGKYGDLRNALLQEAKTIENELHSLAKEKKENHKSLMREQERAKKSKLRGQKLAEQKRYLPAVADLKASYASKTAGKKNSAISAMRENLNERLSDLQFSENIKIERFYNISAKAVMS